MHLQSLSGFVSLFFVPSECQDLVVFVDNAQHHNVASSYFFFYDIYIITIIIIRI